MKIFPLDPPLYFKRSAPMVPGIKVMVLSAHSNNMVAMDRLVNILDGGPHYEGDHQLFNGVSN